MYSIQLLLLTLEIADAFSRWGRDGILHVYKMRQESQRLRDFSTIFTDIWHWC